MRANDNDEIFVNSLAHKWNPVLRLKPREAVCQRCFTTRRIIWSNFRKREAVVFVINGKQTGEQPECRMIK